MDEYNNIPANMRLGGGASASNLNPIVLALLLIAIILIFLLPRKYVVVPILLVTFLTPFGQQLYLAGVHVYVSRILILCGWIRIGRTERMTGGFNPVDKMFVLWAIFRASATFLEFLDRPAAINQCGFLLDAVGGYLLLRFLIQDEEDILRVVKTFAVIASIMALTMLNEKFNGLNLFGFIGGRLQPFIRDGAIRAQATFRGQFRPVRSPLPSWACSRGCGGAGKRSC